MQKITKNQRARLYQGIFTTHIVADFHGYEKIPIRLLALRPFLKFGHWGSKTSISGLTKSFWSTSLHRWPRSNKALGFANDLFNALVRRLPCPHLFASRELHASPHRRSRAIAQSAA